LQQFTYTQTDATFNFTSTSTDATNWKWFFGDTDFFPYISGDTTENPTHTYMATGTYTVYLIVSNECGSDTISQTVTITTLSSNNIEIKGLEIYPNPTHDFININSDISETILIEIFDASGKCILMQETSTINTKINVADFENGFYWLKIRTKENVNTIPFIKIIKNIKKQKRLCFDSEQSLFLL
jgi:PKD repeat protein